MAPKRKTSLLENPPAASSSEDEDVEEEEEVEEVEEVEEEEEHEGEEEYEEKEDCEEEEDEVTKGNINPSSSVKKPKSYSKTPSSDDDDEEEEGSEESDSEPPPKFKPLGPSRGSNPSGGKPIASKPKKTLSEPSKVTPIVSSTAAVKRSLESEKDSKRKKKKVDDDDDDDDDGHQEETERRTTFGPNSIFQRVWSDDDEIVLLKGMIEFKKKGVDPFSDLSEFLESIKKSLHVEVRPKQLDNKIKRLRRKYLNNFKKANGDEDPVFSKPHEVLSYQLMKEIWGGKEGNIRGGENSNGKDDSVVANGKRSKSKKSNNDVSPVRTKMLSDISMRELPKLDGSNGLDLIGDSKTKDLEQKWRSLHAAELKLYMRRIELVREQTIAILDAYESSDV